MIGVEEFAELPMLRGRPRMPMTIAEEQGPSNHHQQAWQIHLSDEKIWSKNRSHPSATRLFLGCSKLDEYITLTK